MAKWAETAEEAQLSVELAGPLYLNLLRAKPYEEIKALHDGVQSTLQRLKLPDKIAYEQNAWLNALISTYPDKVVIEMLETVKRLKDAKTVDDVFLKADCTDLAYQACFKKRQPDQAKDIHTQVQEFLMRFTRTEEAFTDHANYECARILYLRDTDKPKYLTEVLPTLLDIIDKSKSFTQIRPALSTAAYYGPYQDLFQSGHATEAKTLTEHMQAALVRIDPTSVASQKLDKNAYLWSFANFDMPNFLPLYLLLVAKAEKTGTPDDIELLAQQAAKAYTALLEAGRLDEVKQVHGQLQVAAKRLAGGEKLAATEYQQYMTALAAVAPQDYLAEMQPLLEKVAKAQTAEDALQLLPMVQMAYLPLNQSGNFSHARTAHEQLQTVLTKFNRTAEATKDNQIFKDSLSKEALDGMLQLFKKAMIGNDKVTAKKWLDELNNAAPECPQASRARAIWKEANAGK